MRKSGKSSFGTKSEGEKDVLIPKINKFLMFGWLCIVGILLVSYFGEVLKGERTLAYFLVFILITTVPAVVCFFIYRRKPDMFELRYCIVTGYFLMYLFCMITGSSSMIFSYILPLLSLLVLYHQPRLIVCTGAASLLVNIIFIALRFVNGDLNMATSKNAEIQIALIFLCFAGAYAATKLYDEITKQNHAYVTELNEKNSQISQMTVQTIATIVNILDAKDKYTEGHSIRVAEYVVLIAQEMGAYKGHLDDVRSVALLHDIGKIGVPDSILNKPGKLTNSEFDVMKRHTIIGGNILSEFDMLPDIAVGAKYHHERYDGSGYPEHLRGEEIPLIARIISVADAYDAMTSNRVYRANLFDDKVWSELCEGKGTQFDPNVVDAMLRLIEKGSLDSIRIKYNDHVILKCR